MVHVNGYKNLNKNTRQQKFTMFYQSTFTMFKILWYRQVPEEQEILKYKCIVLEFVLFQKEILV